MKGRDGAVGPHFSALFRKRSFSRLARLCRRGYAGAPESCIETRLEINVSELLASR